MEPVLTPDEMRAADESAIAAGTPGVVLMDRAAYACATVALRRLGRGYGRRVAIVAGKGSNGGDGIAAAGHLAARGVLVELMLTAEPSGDAAAHLARAVRHRRVRAGALDPDALAHADLVVDAVFGTGFSGAP